MLFAVKQAQATVVKLALPGQSLSWSSPSAPRLSYSAASENVTFTTGLGAGLTMTFVAEVGAGLGVVFSTGFSSF